MPKLVLKNARVTVDGVDISSHVRTCTLEEEYDEVDVTSFGDATQRMMRVCKELKLSLQMMGKAAENVSVALRSVDVSHGHGGMGIAATSGSGLLQFKRSFQIGGKVPTTSDVTKALKDLPEQIVVPMPCRFSSARVLSAKEMDRALREPDPVVRQRLWDLYGYDAEAREAGEELVAKVGRDADGKPMFVTSTDLGMEARAS